jgi:uncharacterized membrane protein YhaH (DUF805 family)
MNLPALLFSFQGRLNRAPYWLALIAVDLGFAAVIAVAAVVIGKLALVIFIPAFGLLIWIGLALGVKRLHDRDKSAWWLLLFYVVPSLLDGIGRLVGWAGFILDLIGAAIVIWALIELGFLRGTKGPNNYGPDPLLGQAPA